MKKDFALGALVATIAVAAILSFSPIASTAGHTDTTTATYTPQQFAYTTKMRKECYRKTAQGAWDRTT